MTLHSDYVKMSYGSHIKIKILAGLLLGDFKNFLIPPRICPTTKDSCRSWDLTRLKCMHIIVLFIFKICYIYLIFTGGWDSSIRKTSGQEIKGMQSILLFSKFINCLLFLFCLKGTSCVTLVSYAANLNVKIFNIIYIQGSPKRNRTLIVPSIWSILQIIIHEIFIDMQSRVIIINNILYYFGC